MAVGTASLAFPATTASATEDPNAGPDWTTPAGKIDAGYVHTCAILNDGTVRCWGSNDAGQLGYGDPLIDMIGDDENPASAGAVDLGAGHTAIAITAGHSHTCAILDDGAVRCWGSNDAGQLGYGDPLIDMIGDDETPGSVDPVDLGAGRAATAITAGTNHTCAILDDGAVRCWGAGAYGKLGYGDILDIGDDETPGSVDPVDLGAGRTATQIAAGDNHTCAVLDNGRVRCWGLGGYGQLGYGNPDNIGDDESPASAGPVDLGAGRSATAITVGEDHSCAILDAGSVRCWGWGFIGQLGYGNTDNIGDDESPASAGPVDLGAGRSATRITAGHGHVCAILDDATVRCWGLGDDGQLGYGNTDWIGNDVGETPSSVGPVDIAARDTTAITAGLLHTCAVLDNGRVRCWGLGDSGQLGYGNPDTIGDDETPRLAGSVILGGLVQQAIEAPHPALPVE